MNGGGGRMASRSGGAAMGSNGYGMDDSYDSFGVDTPGSRIKSVQAGSSPNSFDYSRGGDHGSYRDDYYESDDYYGRDDFCRKDKSLRDAGVKDEPSSALGSIASNAQKRVKEIDRYVNDDIDDRPRAPRGRRARKYKLPEPGSNIGEYGGDGRRRNNDNSRYPPGRPRRSRRMDDSSGYDEYDSYDEYGTNGMSTSRGRRGPEYQESRDDSYSYNNGYESKRTDGYNNDYEDADDRRYDAPRGRSGDSRPPPRRRNDRYNDYEDYDDRDDRRYDDAPRGRSGSMRRGRGDDFYDDRDDRRYNAPRGRRSPRRGDDGGWGMESRSFGSRSVDYRSFNDGYDYGYDDRSGPRRRDYERGQSLVDYQLRPPRRRGPPPPDAYLPPPY